MKFYQKALGIALSGILALGLTACGFSAKAALQAAEEKMQTVSSLESELVTEMGMTIGEESVNMATTMDMTIFNDPMKLKGEITLDMGELGAQNASLYIEETDGTVMMYTGMLGNWMIQELSAEQLEAYDTQKSLTTYFNNIKKVQKSKKGTNDTEGITTYEGVISKDALEETLEASGTLENLEPILSGTGISAEDLYKDVADIPVSIWIDSEGYPVKYEMDMTDMMQGVMKNLGDLSGASEEEIADTKIDVMKISITNDNFDAVEDFTIPEEAKSGVMMPTAE